MGSGPSPDRPQPRGTSARTEVPRPTRPAWAEIDLDAVRDNLRALRGAAAPARMLAVVKADAYGHGAVHVARVAVEAGAWGLGVATVDEGIELRRAGIAAAVLVLGAVRPEEAEAAVAHDLRLTVSETTVALAASRTAGTAGRVARLHLKVDTGMGRLGVAPGDAVPLANRIAGLPHVVLEGCFTHFAGADEVDPASASGQLEVFRAVLEGLERAGVRPTLRHAANSAATLALPASRLDLVRCGIALYGIPPAPHLAGRVALRPVMRLCARIVYRKRVPAGTPVGYGHTHRTSRETTLATLPVGYADGYPRLAGDGCTVLLAGRCAPIVGRISMDQMTVDAGDTPVEPGDEVELWGPAVPVEIVARAARTISYEVLARTARRVPRVYLERGRVCAVRTLCGDQ
ncbi:MAG TPA: alanine racemase [bacterium]|nr:alanine racemase [bacterium]